MRGGGHGRGRCVGAGAGPLPGTLFVFEVQHPSGWFQGEGQRYCRCCREVLRCIVYRIEQGTWIDAGRVALEAKACIDRHYMMYAGYKPQD